MRCPQCQHENPEGSRFCNQCAASLDASASACSHPNPPGSRFCNRCGRAIPAAAAASRYVSPDSYTPKHLAEKILTSRGALEGERKQVTVLFCDLANFTGMSEKLDPEDLHELMDRVFDALLAEVHRYEGTVNQFTGDGIMALFGAPLALEDHAARAVEAALAIQDSMGRAAREFLLRWGQSPALRIGVNTGRVVVGKIGDDLRMDYTAQGDTVNLAARLQALAAPATVAISESTHQLVAGYFDCVSLGQHTVKGKSVPVEVFRPARKKTPRSRLAIASEAGLSPFVGRDAEMQALTEAMSAARGGEGRAVTVLGEAGIGKSRFLFEFRKRIEPGTASWIEGHCVAYGLSTPYLPVIAILRSVLDLADDEAEADAESRVRARLQALGPEFEPLAPPLLYFLSIGKPDPDVADMPAQERKGYMLETIARYIEGVSRRMPHVLVFEDCQWLDTASEELITFLGDRLARWPVLVILSSRPGSHLPLSPGPLTTRIVLHPLRPDERQALAWSVLRDRPVQPELVATVVEKTGGNPLFIEEVTRSLLDADLSRGADALRIPPTIADVLAARIDRLPELLKSSLQVAAVIGREFSQRLLGQVSDRPESVPEALVKLVEAEMIVEKAGGEPTYTFRHTLAQEVAYEGLLIQRRRRLHRRIGQAIEQLHADRPVEHVERLAHHFLQGEEWEKAVPYLRQAGAKAAALCANTEAVTFLQRALQALERMADSPERTRHAIDLRLDLRPPLLQLGRLQEVLALSQEAEGMAERLGDEPRLARVYAYLINYHYLKGEPDLALEYGERCLTLGEASGDLALQALSRQYIGHSYHAQGRYRRAEGILRQNIEALEATSGGDGVARATTSYISSCGWLAFTLAELGEFDLAHAYTERAQQAADASGHAYSQAIAWTLAGLVWARRGHLDQALPPLERSLEICTKKYLAVWRPIPSSLLGLALVLLGRLDEGLRLLEDGVALTEDLGVKAYLALWTGQLGEGLLAAGQVERALAVAQRALELALEHKERGHRAWALRLLGQARQRLEAPPCRLAQEHYAEAMDLATELEMRPLFARCTHELGQLLLRTGDRTSAADCLSRGAAMLREMDLRLEPAKTGDDLQI
ncbi:MAG: AAA family ATPase [Candidatus Rokubacteria bacterium]|nr:AAA family ATPase [Candidatus Rokubacteria bacterium]